MAKKPKHYVMKPDTGYYRVEDQNVHVTVGTGSVVANTAILISEAIVRNLFASPINWQKSGLFTSDSAGGRTIVEHLPNPRAHFTLLHRSDSPLAPEILERLCTRV